MNEPISANAMPALDADRVLPPGRGFTQTQRWISLAEFVLGGAIVIAYNVFHVIPNEVPILFVLGLISLRVRDGGWGAMGLRWPVAWRRTVLIGLAAAATRILMGAVVVDPLTARFWPAAVGPSGFEAITGHAWVALRWLAIVWTFAAFGEEISYRGYLTTRAADVGGRSKGHIGSACCWYRCCSALGTITKGPREWWTREWQGSCWVRRTCCLDGICGFVSWRTGSLIRLEWWRSSSGGTPRRRSYKIYTTRERSGGQPPLPRKPHA